MLVSSQYYIVGNSRSLRKNIFKSNLLWTSDRGRGNRGTMTCIAMFWRLLNAIERLYIFIFTTTQVGNGTSISQINTFRIKSGSTLPELMQLRVFVPEFESRCLLFPLPRATSQKPGDESRCWEIPMSNNTLLTLAAAHIFNENFNEESMNMKWVEWRTTFCIHMSLFPYYYLLLNLAFLGTHSLLMWLLYVLKCVFTNI